MCRGTDKASVTITTGWRRPSVPTPQVRNGSLGDLIRGHSLRFCVPTLSAKRGFRQPHWGSEAGTWAVTQPGSVEPREAGNSAGKLPQLSPPAGAGSSFNSDKGAPLRQRLAACLPVFYQVQSMLDMVSLWGPVLEKGTLALPVCFKQQGKGILNSRTVGIQT